MKKAYTKAECKVVKFETGDVIATSCTCPGSHCHHNCEEFEGNFIPELNICCPIYTHSELPVFNGNVLSKTLVGVCPDHGNIYKLEPNDVD